MRGATPNGSTCWACPRQWCPWVIHPKACRSECKSQGNPGRKNWFCPLPKRLKSSAVNGNSRRRFSNFEFAILQKPCHPDIGRSEDGGTLRRTEPICCQRGSLTPLASSIYTPP